MYTSIAEAVKRHPKVSVMVNFSSFRSVYETTMDALNYSDTIRTLAIIAEGVPEGQTRQIIKAADEKKVGDDRRSPLGSVAEITCRFIAVLAFFEFPARMNTVGFPHL